jgi:hypothetical protein
LERKSRALEIRMEALREGFKGLLPWRALGGLGFHCFIVWMLAWRRAHTVLLDRQHTRSNLCGGVSSSKLQAAREQAFSEIEQQGEGRTMLGCIYLLELV